MMTIALHVLAALALVASGGAQADQRYPDRPVRWIVPAPPGGPMDTNARRIGRKLAAAWGRQVIVDNRPGAAGIIAAELVAKAAPDGYALLHAHNGMIAINPHLYKSLPYDPVKSFAPITTLTAGYAIVLVNPQLPAKTLDELIALAKSKPGQLTYGTSGVGSPQHLTATMFERLTGTQLVHVPYKGSAPIVSDLMAGQIQLAFDYIVPAGEQVRAGKSRALAVASPKRNPYLPDVPTAAEAGLPGFVSRAWTGLFVPVGTPAHIATKIRDDVVRILESPEEQARATELGYEAHGSTPEAFGDFIKAEIAQWGEAVKVSGAKIE